MYKVFVTEDEILVRNGIRNMLDSNTSFSFCGEAPDGEMALPAIWELKPDILIVDIKMPFMSGLELSRIVKRTMPWMGIIIVSGHNEFEYTKEAISIGIDEYMLKPISSKSLYKTLEQVAVKLEDRKKNLLEPNDNKRYEAEKNTLRDHFLGQFAGGLLTMEQFLQSAADYNINLMAKFYIVAEAEIICSNEISYPMALRRQHLEVLLGSRDDIIWFFKGPERFLMISKGDHQETVRDALYQAAQTVQYGMERDANVRLIIGIGTVVERMGQIKTSLEEAHTAMYFLQGSGQNGIIGIDDLKGGNIPISLDLDSTSINKRLRYAVWKDVDNIIEDFLAPCRDGRISSLLLKYYHLMELIMAAGHLIKEIGGNPNEIVGTYMLPNTVLKASSSPEKAEELVRNVVQDTIKFKSQKVTNKSEDLILRAKNYINENYQDSSLSLNVVASFVGFSPNHFSTLFSSQTGNTFIEYLTYVRLENAKKMILENFKISDIAYQIGYHDTRYFNYSFKKYVNLTPREYREKYTRG